MIVHAAIMKEGKVYIGRRHSDIMQSNYGVDFKGCVQGFVDDKGNFLDRVEAANHAFGCGQTKENLNYLMSEDLY